MEPQEAARFVGEACFLDVREPYEFEAGHVHGSLHIPIGEIAARFPEIPTDDTVIVVCQVGQRSALVADWLREQGRDAHNLEGGLQAWVAQGHELEAGAAEGRVVDGYARDLSGRRLTPE